MRHINQSLFHFFFGFRSAERARRAGGATPGNKGTPVARASQPHPRTATEKPANRYVRVGHGATEGSLDDGQIPNFRGVRLVPGKGLPSCRGKSASVP
jgi:hypothetical protein